MPYKDKEVRNANARAHYQRNLERRRAQIRASDKKRRAKNPQEFRRKQNEQRKRSGTGLRAGLRATLKRLGVSHERYQSMVDKSDGACYICKCPPGEFRHPIDHCHASGEVRGILCHDCNVAIGRAKDDPKRLIAAAKYLYDFFSRQLEDMLR